MRSPAGGMNFYKVPCREALTRRVMLVAGRISNLDVRYEKLAFVVNLGSVTHVPQFRGKHRSGPFFHVQTGDGIGADRLNGMDDVVPEGAEMVTAEEPGAPGCARGRSRCPGTCRFLISIPRMLGRSWWRCRGRDRRRVPTRPHCGLVVSRGHCGRLR